MVREVVPLLKCTRCGGSEFRTDGSQKVPIDHPYGVKQRLKCKQCGRIKMGGWISFDKKAYDKLKKEEFQEYLQYRKDYKQAKEELGFGGFRMEDL